MMDFPTWEEIVGTLQDKFERTYRIDIETNSTIDLEATEDKQSMSEFMNAFGQMSAGLATMGEQGLLPFDATKEIMGELFRRYRFGRKIEQILEMAQPPQGNHGAQQAAQAAKEAGLQSQVSAAQAMTQQVREQLRKQAADFEQNKTTLISALEKKEIEIATLKGTSQIDQKVGEHALAAKDLEHKTDKLSMTNQIGGVQRNLEMERLNSTRQGNQHQMDLSDRDKQLTDLSMASSAQERDNQHALARKDDELTHTKRTHEQEKFGMQFDGKLQEVKHGQDGLGEKLKSASKPEGAKKPEGVGELVEHHKALQEMVAKLAEMVGSPRETTIEVGKDGKKKGVSKIVKGEK